MVVVFVAVLVFVNAKGVMHCMLASLALQLEVQNRFREFCLLLGKLL